MKSVINDLNFEILVKALLTRTCSDDL